MIYVALVYIFVFIRFYLCSSAAFYDSVMITIALFVKTGMVTAQRILAIIILQSKRGLSFP
jgi:hypothetical protein